MSTKRPRAWVLNLDAELELAHGAGYAPSAAVLSAAAKARPHIVGLIGPEDLLVDPREPERNSAHGLEGRAWCPTPSALRALERAGARLPEAPDFELLRQVNHRAFALQVDPGPLDAAMVYELAALESQLARHPGPWRLKRALSFAGRGHRRITRALDDDDRRWCASAFRRGGGLLVERDVQRLADFALHGWVHPEGHIALGQPLSQHCSELGAWLSCAPIDTKGELAATAAELQLLQQKAREAGEALHAAGYFGPYGIDAFRYLEDSQPRFHPLVEINARYSMAWGASGCAQSTR